MTECRHSLHHRCLGADFATSPAATTGIGTAWDEGPHRDLVGDLSKYASSWSAHGLVPQSLSSDGPAGDAKCTKDSVNYWKAPEFMSWLYNDSPVKDTVHTLHHT